VDNLKSFIAIINDNITDSITTTVSKQLFVNEVITIADFDFRMKNNPNYIEIVHGTNQRVLVKANFSDSLYHTYKCMVDMCLFCKNGLMYIEKNKLGSEGEIFQIKDIQVFTLIHKRRLEFNVFDKHHFDDHCDNEYHDDFYKK
jgi:hypothetical protein